MSVYETMASKPEVYLKDGSKFREVLKTWCNPFSGLALICNRKTPLHRDNNSRYCWYDILATLGTYGNLSIDIPAIGMKFSYKPGTMMAIAGRAFTHGVDMADGERICFAYFIRDKVHQMTGFLDHTMWSTVDEVEARIKAAMAAGADCH